MNASLQNQTVPVDAQNALTRGHAYYHGDPPDYAAAERSFRQAIELAPNWGEGFHALGSVLQQLNKLDEACAAERTAIQLLDSDPRPLIALGWILRLMGKYAEAASFLVEGLKLKPHYGEADARLMLAEVYEHLGQLDMASLLWRQIITMESMYPSYDRPMLEAKKKLAEHGQ